MLTGIISKLVPQLHFQRLFHHSIEWQYLGMQYVINPKDPTVFHPLPYLLCYKGILLNDGIQCYMGSWVGGSNTS